MRINVREAGDVRIVDIEGNITIGLQADELRRTVKWLVADGHNKFLLNLQSVSLIDSAGIGELVACKKRAAEKDGDTKLLMPTKRVHDTLVMMRLIDVFDLFKEEDSALDSFV